MSRYANRLQPSSSSSSHHHSEQYDRGGGPQQSRGYGGRYADEDEGEEDDETAVATDLSGLQHRPRRSVAFGENILEEFNGSEAPDAIRPVSSLGQRYAPSPLPPGGIGRPRSTSMNEQRLPPALPPSSLPPPPPPPDYRYDSSYHNHRRQDPSAPPPPQQPTYRSRSPGPSYHRPVSFARGEGYEEDDGRRNDDEYYDSDEDDAFTAVGTGVATDLDLEDEPAPLPPSSSAARGRYDSRAPYDYHYQQRESYLAVPRPSSRGPQINVNRSSPRPHPPPPPHSYSPSGYPTSDFSLDDSSSVHDYAPFDRRQQQAGLMPPPPVPSSSRRTSLAPPRSLSRPASTGSMRMLIDEDGEGGLPPLHSRGIGSDGTPSQGRVGFARHASPMLEDLPPAPPRAPPVTEDSPVEKELIALLKELRFSIALKDFHDTMKIGVQKTLVAEDGMGNAYCKVHCKKLPQAKDLVKEKHLAQHWVNMGSSRWEFRTASHRVTVVFKTEALAAYESQFLTSRR